MKKLFFLLLFSFCFSQNKTVLTEYPKNQSSYVGGLEQYYKDINTYIINNNIKPCTNPNEFYQFDVLITPEENIKFIKERNQKYVEQNKCAYELARAAAKVQTGWQAAEYYGKKVNAVDSFIIYPADLFEKYYDGYTPKIFYPTFGDNPNDNLEYFGKELISKLDLRPYIWNDIFTVESEFTITKDGKMKDIIMTKSSGMEAFDKMIIFAYKDIRKRWKPAVINGVTVEYRMKYTLRATTETKY